MQQRQLKTFLWDSYIKVYLCHLLQGISTLCMYFKRSFFHSVCTKVTANSHLRKFTYPTLLSALLKDANASRFICFPDCPVGLVKRRGSQATFWRSRSQEWGQCLFCEKDGMVSSCIMQMGDTPAIQWARRKGL